MARNIDERLYEEEFMELDHSRKWPVHARRRAQETARLYQQDWMSEAESHLKRTTQQPALKSYLQPTLASKLDSPSIHF